MKTIRRFWRIYQPFIQKHGISLFLDYDGTLTPLVFSPEKAFLSAAMRRILVRLQNAPGVSLCVVSGRSVRTLRHFLKIPSLLLAGNHGCHVEGKGVHFLHPKAKAFHGKIPNLEKLLKRRLKGIPGILFERKTYGLTLNYNKVSPAAVRSIEQILKSEFEERLRKRGILLTEGKKIWEFRPAGAWNKGQGVLWILSKKPANKHRPLPVYLGDDETDEDAFRALKKTGVGIRVTSRPLSRSSAAFYLASVKEVKQFLEDLLRVVKGSFDDCKSYIEHSEGYQKNRTL